MESEQHRPARQAPPGARRRCSECRGAGQVPGLVKTTSMGKGMGSSPGTCPTCDGVGWLSRESEVPQDPRP